MLAACSMAMVLSDGVRTKAEGTSTPQRKRVVAPIGYDLPPEELDQPPASQLELMRQAESPRKIAQRGGLTSIQVNVNAAQNNIIGDAANEPSIAISPANPNQIVIAWRQFDSIASNFREAGMSYSHNRGATWNMFTLQNGQFRSDPVLGADAAGRFFFSSLSSTTSVQLFRSLDGGINWTMTGAFGGDKQWIAVDDRPSGQGAGHIYQNWNVQFSCCPPNDFCRSINNGASMQSPVAIPTPSLKWGTLDTGPDGSLYIAGSNLGNTGHLLTKSITARDPAATPTFSAVIPINMGGNTVTGGINPAGMLGPLWIAVDNSTGPTSGNLYALGTVNNGSDPNPTNVRFIRSTDDGQTWSAPVLVNDDPNSGAWHWFGTMSVAPNGRIDAIWNDTRNAPAENSFMTEVFYSYSLNAGQTWSANIPLTPAFDPSVGYPQQNKLGDYYHMVSDNGGANLAYAATFNGEEDVYFLRIPRDCNDNGIEDDCDIACGAPGTRCDVGGCGLLGDCNDNAIPDACEPNEDCNSNTVPDICDIANATSQDCNFNQVPDECEAALDCNNNSVADFCDIASGFSQDCNGNSIPDECDIGTISTDANNDEVPDECQGACCTCVQCADVSIAACQALGGAFSGLGTLCGSQSACTPSTPANDACAQATILPSEPSVSEPFNNTCATTDGPASVDCPSAQPVGKDLWYKYTAPCSGSVTVSTCGTTSMDAIIDVYGGQAVCPCPTTSAGLITCGDDTCGIGGGPAQVTFNVTAGMCYTIRVAGWNSASGNGLVNLSYNTSCEVTPPTPQPDPLNNKCRYVSMTIHAAAKNMVAIRVTLTSLHHVNPPYSGGPSTPFTSFEGQTRWVGPPQAYTESAANPATFWSAALQCTPHYQQWNSQGLIHVTGSGIVPSSTYSVQTLDSNCAGSEGSCTDISPALLLGTTRWGDVVSPYNPPATTAQPDFGDISAMVDKFRSAPGAIRKVQALLDADDQFGVFDPAGEINFSDIAHCVEAFRGRPYPFTIATCP